MLHLKTVRQQTLLLALLLSAPLMSITSCTKASDASTQEGIKINATNFPDENFRSYLLGQDYGADGVLTAEEIEGITKIHIIGENISSLKGIEHFTALTTLRCAGNQLTALDVSGCTALTELWCYSTQLTALDVSGCTALTRLECYNNQLTTVDVSKNTALTFLDCSGNQLTTLDVSKCTALTEVYCSNNQIKGSAMDSLIGSLPQTDSGKFAVYNRGYGNYKYKSEEGNVCTKTQVAAAKAKGWTSFQATGAASLNTYVNGVEEYMLTWSFYEGSND